MLTRAPVNKEGLVLGVQTAVPGTVQVCVLSLWAVAASGWEQTHRVLVLLLIMEMDNTESPQTSPNLAGNKVCSVEP